jgi:hypothetical protein
MWRRTFGVAAIVLSAFVAGAPAAELPSQARKAKPPEAAAVKKCNIDGIAGVLAANGVCVRMSGSITAVVGAGQSK